MSEIEKSNPENSAESDFSGLDIEFVRVLEDLIDALIANGTLRLTDLPPKAVEKLNQRKKVRARLRNSLDLLTDDDLLI